MGQKFLLADFAELLPGEGAIRVCRVRAIEPSPYVFEVLIARDAGPDAPINRLATAIMASARLPIVDPIRGDAVHCCHVTSGDAEAFT